MKWDYEYAIGELKPDVIVQLWGDDDLAQNYIRDHYAVVEMDGYQFSVRRDSPEILWERFETDP
jgi:hypothetical protein